MNSFFHGLTEILQLQTDFFLNCWFAFSDWPWPFSFPSELELKTWQGGDGGWGGKQVKQKKHVNYKEPSKELKPYECIKELLYINF